jgi:hypothetical protein
VFRGAVELVEERYARGTGTLLEREQRRLAAPWPRPLVAGITREHETVDHQRVTAGLEQLRELHVGWGPVGTHTLEDVVLGNNPAERQLAPRGGHRLHRAAQLDLLGE